MKLVFIGLQISASQMYYNNEEVFDGNDNMLSIWRHYGTIMEPVRTTACRIGRRQNSSCQVFYRFSRNLTSTPPANMTPLHFTLCPLNFCFSFSSAKWCSPKLAQFWDQMHCRICPKNYHSHLPAVVGEDPTSQLHRSALLIILWPYLKLTLLYIHRRSVWNKTHWSCLHLTCSQHSYIHCNTRMIYTAIIKPNLNLVPLLYW